MRDRPNGYLFESIEDCCAAHFSYDKSCGYNNPARIWYYPSYQEATCYERPRGEFDAYDTEKFATKVSDSNLEPILHSPQFHAYISFQNICCMEKFNGDVLTCCNGGEGECALAGASVYIPNWNARKCEARDSSLVSNWEKDWISSTIEECCEECKYIIS